MTKTDKIFIVAYISLAIALTILTFGVHITKPTYYAYNNTYNNTVLKASQYHCMLDYINRTGCGT